MFSFLLVGARDIEIWVGNIFMVGIMPTYVEVGCFGRFYFDLMLKSGAVLWELTQIPYNRENLKI